MDVGILVRGATDVGDHLVVRNRDVRRLRSILQVARHPA